MTPDELRSLADEATPRMNEDHLTDRYWEAQTRLRNVAPDLARLCAELGEALEPFVAAKPLHTHAFPPYRKAARAALAKLAELK